MNLKIITDVYNVTTGLNCDREALVGFNELMRSLAVYGNLYRLLKHYHDECFMKCKKEYPKSLYKTVEEIGSEKIPAIMTLRDTISIYLREFKGDMPFYTPKAFDKGISTYLAKHRGRFAEKWEKDKMISKAELAILYDNEVVSMCSSLGDAFYREAEFFLRVVATDPTLAKMNELTAKFWMTISYICQDASKRRQQVIENVYNLMVTNPRRRNFFKWMHNGNVSERKVASF